MLTKSNPPLFISVDLWLLCSHHYELLMFSFIFIIFISVDMKSSFRRSVTSWIPFWIPLLLRLGMMSNPLLIGWRISYKSLYFGVTGFSRHSLWDKRILCESYYSFWLQQWSFILCICMVSCNVFLSKSPSLILTYNSISYYLFTG